MPAFGTDEYRDRLAGIRALMADAGMDALLVLSGPNLVYLTGYEGVSDYVPQAGLVTADDEEPYLLLREMDIACAIPTCWMGEDRLIPYPERFIGSAERTPWQPIAEFVAGKTRSKR